MTDSDLFNSPTSNPATPLADSEPHTSAIDAETFTAGGEDMLKMMPLEEISIYGGTQARASTNDDAIDSYVESIEGGQSFPPIEVYFDGAKYWLADGFHRLLAYKRAGQSTVQSKIYKGSRKDALLHALGANSQNSLYRSNADKRNAVEIALEEFPEETNAFIAKICSVSSTMVSNARKRLEELNREEEEVNESKPTTQPQAKQVSVPAGGIARQSRGGGSGDDGGDRSNGKKRNNNKEFSDEEVDDLECIDLPSNDVSAEPHERSSFVYADNAIQCLSKIRKHDPDAKAAFSRVADWLKVHA